MKSGGVFDFWLLMDTAPTPNYTAAAANVIPVVESMPADLLTPLSVYLKLAENSEYSFLLESVTGGESLARYSFVGCDPESVVLGGSKFTNVRTGVTSERLSQSLFEFLKEHFSLLTAAGDRDLPPFIGGAIGYMGFSCVDWFEAGLYESDAETDAEFMIYRTIVAFDHARQVVKIISLVFVDEAEGSEDKLGELINEATRTNAGIRSRLENTDLSIPSLPPEVGKTEPVSNFEQAGFEDSVTKIKELIKAGDCYQVVLSQRFTKATAAGPVAVYRALRTINPSPYMFLLNLGRKAIIGASPEMLVKCEGRKLTYHPIAGTRPRGTDSIQDDALAGEMRQDPKEVAEHLMLVDLGRNDLGRVAEFGSVKVDDLMAVEKYSHVQHLVSTVTARLREDRDRFDALAACFPAGTVSGAPKVRAIEIIRDLEPTSRGIYSGAVGYFDYSGNMDTCIAIRTLVLENGEASIQAGAGIVADSVPEAEYNETINKAKVLIRAVEMAEEGLF
jgi:anthranilate synthase component 1